MKIISLAVVLSILTGCGAAPQQPQQPAKQASTPKPADEEAALSSLADINKAQSDYFVRNRRYALTYEELIDALFLKSDPSPEISGYDIKLRPAADAARYAVIATPISSSPTTRHFMTDQTGDIHFEQGKDATAESPKINQ